MRRYFKASGEDPRDVAIRLYACVLVLLSGGLVLGLVLAEGFGKTRSLWPLLAFAFLAIMAERQSVRFTENIELSVAFLPLLFVAVVFGPLAAAAIGAVTVLPDLGRLLVIDPRDFIQYTDECGPPIASVLGEISATPERLGI